MKDKSGNFGTKMSARTRKMNGEFGSQVLESRRSGLKKVLSLLSRGTDVQATPLAVEHTANTYSL